MRRPRHVTVGWHLDARRVRATVLRTPAPSVRHQCGRCVTCDGGPTIPLSIAKFAVSSSSCPPCGLDSARTRARCTSSTHPATSTVVSSVDALSSQIRSWYGAGAGPHGQMRTAQIDHEKPRRSVSAGSRTTLLAERLRTTRRAPGGGPSCALRQRSLRHPASRFPVPCASADQASSCTA